MVQTGQVAHLIDHGREKINGVGDCLTRTERNCFESGFQLPGATLEGIEEADEAGELALSRFRAERSHGFVEFFEMHYLRSRILRGHVEKEGLAEGMDFYPEILGEQSAQLLLLVMVGRGLLLLRDERRYRHE